MKRRRQMIALVSVLALLIAGIVAVKLLNPEAEQEDSAVTVLSLDVNTVTALSWTNGEGSVSFVLENGSWKYAEDRGFPLDQSALGEMLKLVCQIVADRKVAEPQAISEYGLAEPTCTIRIEAAGKTAELLIGIQNAVDKLCYLSNGDGNVYLVESSLRNHFSKGLLDMVVKEEIPDMTLAFGLSIETGRQSLEMVYSSDAWYLKDTETLLDAGSVQNLLDTFVAMSWGKCVAYNAQEADLEKYGLDVPGALVEVTYTENSQQETFRLELGDTTDDGCYARIASSGMVYIVDDAILNAANIEQDALLAE